MSQDECTKENILAAAKERDFARVVRSHSKWLRTDEGKGSHVKEFYRRADGGEQMVPWAAHHGEVSIGVRRSFVRIMMAAGLLLLAFGCAIAYLASH
jgi:hypothetical protein